MSEIRYDFGTGRSDPGTFPMQALQQAAVDAIAEEAEALTNYHGKLGHVALRKAMARRESEREGVPVDPDHLALTNGSMQAVTLTAEALMENFGDDAIVETFCYPGTLSAYRSLRLNLHGVNLDADGLRLDQLEDHLKALDGKGRRPRFIYTISTYQNPVGCTLTRDRRLELIALAVRFGVPVIEDNCYGDVHYEGPVAPALYALTNSPDHIYLCSLSKILAPGLRLGYLYARPPMLEKILARRHDAGGNHLAAAIVARFYKDGIGAHADYANAALKEKRDLLLSCLETELSELCAWSHPAGGLFLWVRVPNDVDRRKLMQTANAAGVTYLPGAAFHYRNEDVPFLRLAFGHLTAEQIAEGVPLLANAVRRCRTSNEPVRSLDLYGD